MSSACALFRDVGSVGARKGGTCSECQSDCRFRVGYTPQLPANEGTGSRKVSVVACEALDPWPHAPGTSQETCLRGVLLFRTQRGGRRSCSDTYRDLHSDFVRQCPSGHGLQVAEGRPPLLQIRAAHVVSGERGCRLDHREPETAHRCQPDGTKCQRNATVAGPDSTRFKGWRAVGVTGCASVRAERVATRITGRAIHSGGSRACEAGLDLSDGGCYNWNGLGSGPNTLHAYRAPPRLYGGNAMSRRRTFRVLVSREAVEAIGRDGESRGGGQCP